MDDFLIDGLWILEIDSGICVFEENYKEWSQRDTQLISSFLSAVRSFTKESFSEDIQFIQFSTRKIIFEISGQILFIIAISNLDINDEIIKLSISAIVKKFIKKYKHIIKRSSLIQDFKELRSFSNDLKDIIGQEPVKLKLLLQEQIERITKSRNDRRLRRMEEMKRCSS